MNILFLTHRLPFPPDRGDRIRSYNQIQYLARRHRISLAAITDHRPDDAHIRHLQTLCATIDIACVDPRRRHLAAACRLPTTVPLTLPLYASRTLTDAIRRRLRTDPFDIVFIYCSAMAQYVLSCPPLPKVIDFIDADSQKWFDYARTARWPMKAIYWREGVLMRRYERHVANACLHGFAASDRETAILRRIAPRVPFATVRNGVIEPPTAHLRKENHRLIFTGVMDYWPNVDAMTHFVREIFPSVRAQLPDAELVIVGQRPTREVRRLADFPGVSVTGWVSDVSPYLASAAVFVAPLRIARGVQNKILEAMAAGVPVVSTSSGLEGLAAVPGQDLLVADSPTLFAAHVASLLLNKAKRDELRRSAIRFIRSNHRWDEQLDHLEKTLVQVVQGHRAHATTPSR